MQFVKIQASDKPFSLPVWVLARLFKICFEKSIVFRIGYLALLRKTSTITMENQGRYRSLLTGMGVILAGFHCDQIPLYLTITQVERENLAFLIGKGGYGNFQERFLKRHLNCKEVVRGSSEGNGFQAARAYLQKGKTGKSIVVFVDGPHGPRFQLKRGVDFFSRQLNIPIVHVSVTLRPEFWLPTWDRMRVPVPFGKIHVTYQDPVFPIAQGNGKLTNSSGQRDKRPLENS